jgi:hypothetical protein
VVLFENLVLWLAGNTREDTMEAFYYILDRACSGKRIWISGKQNITNKVIGG